MRGEAYDEQGSARRRDILRAATETFARSGYFESSVERVAAVAGVSTPAVYYHFGGKEGLLAAALHAALDGFTAEVAAARPSRVDRDADSVSVVIRAGWDWWRTHPDAARLVIRYSEGPTARGSHIRRDWEQWYMDSAHEYTSPAMSAHRPMTRDSDAVNSLTIRLVLDVMLDGQAANLPGQPLEGTAADNLAIAAQGLCVRLISGMHTDAPD